MVLEGGELQIGTAANPVAVGVQAEVIFPDIALDTAADPAQYGQGLIVLGKVTMHGQEKPGYIRLAAEPLAGQTTLSLSEAAPGWLAGDKVILPDSRQLFIGEKGDDYVSQLEVMTIASVSADGKTVTLTAPLQFSHRGARNSSGVLEFLPHAVDITHNVTIKSANSLGTRGQAMFTYRADVDVEQVRFAGLGRTKVGALDNTTFDAAGNPTHIGTNQDDRNPVQFRHLIGPTTPQANGYQYTFDGNSVVCLMNAFTYIWGVNVNDSHYGLIQDNVSYNWAAAGFVTKTGQESYNVIAHNLVIRTGGTAQRDDDTGRSGSGFWLHGPNNYVRDNVATTINGAGGDVYTYGFNIYARYLGSVHIPTVQGADPSVSGQWKSVNMNDTPILEFARKTKSTAPLPAGYHYGGSAASTILPMLTPCGAWSKTSASGTTTSPACLLTRRSALLSTAWWCEATSVT